MQNYRKLNPRLRRFAEAISAGKTAKDAALVIRPHSKCPRGLGYKLRHLPTVAAAIEELEADAIREAGITRAQVLLDVKSILSRCMQAEPILDREGNATGEYKFDSAGANRAAELLGKYLKLWTDKVEATGKDGGPLAMKTIVEFVGDVSPPD